MEGNYIVKDVVDLDKLKGIIEKAKKLAKEYYQLTGKPLGITGEIGEYTAAGLLNLKLTDARHPGYDAIGPDGRRIQIKSRCKLPNSKPSQRTGRINLSHDFDTVILLILDERFEPQAIYEAKREDVERELKKPRPISERDRSDLSFSKFIQVSKKVWPDEK
jgi:hypothetical protein